MTCLEGNSDSRATLRFEGNNISFKRTFLDLRIGRKAHKLSVMYKMVSKLALPYLCDLCPDLGIFAYFTFVKIGTKNSFLFLSIKWWNSLPLEIRTSSSLGILKHSLYLQFPTRNYLFVLGIVQRQYLTLTCDLILVP